MNLNDWIPAVSTTSSTAAILAGILWLCRSLITTRLTKSVRHEFDAKLESLRAELRQNEELFKADLRTKETEIAALRGGAMTAMASRQMALDKRRLEAVDQLWSAVTALSPAKSSSSLMAIMNYDWCNAEATRNAKLREVFAALGSGFDIRKFDFSISAKARPFVTPMVWALFSAYQAILLEAVVKVELLKSGIDAKDRPGNKEVISRLLKAVFPKSEALVDNIQESAYHYLLDELETRLLDEFRKMLAGVEDDKASIEQAAEIVRQSNALMDSAKQTEANSIPSNQP